MNKLYYGDNLEVLRRHIRSESVDLVYLDPPFQSGRDYNVLFEEQDGTKAKAQIKAFEDTWEWDTEAAQLYDETVREGGSVGNALEAFRQLLGGTPMLAYLSMMAPRLVELRRVLKPTGSIYLHCDSTAGAYLRLLMDSVFGPKNFRNDILWYYYNKMHDRRKKLFPRATDTLLFYVKDVTEPFVFKQLKEMRDKPTMQLARKKVDGRIVNAKDEDGHVIYRLKEDRTIDNVWRISTIQPADTKQRMGYPTQKPERLLERVIEASSNEGDVVLDPFCGCGTAIAVAQRMRRNWIGIDVTHLAVGLIKYRLLHSFGSAQGKDYEVIGEPTTLEGAIQLASDDRHQFEHWSLGLVGARKSAKAKGADKGVDGQLSFQEGGVGSPHQKVLISVKSGKVSSPMIRDLRGVLEREKAAIGLFITLEQPSRDMRTEAANAGFYESPWGKHAKLQILTIEDLLGGKSPDLPPFQRGGTTFAIPGVVPDEGQQGELL
ncbi:DNA methyltransferase [Devosia rhizoryzae]|uniref:Methyltransferase n=1 Tax=Devosia rhizoryzae TaxID=2774137 RepID=A0ABX7C9G4_9HYPH|nr:DNA methyltransferase [Devosia rhizoryzae]QQR39914.1 restriction endonuclease [Devosia rhizoryzae]